MIKHKEEKKGEFYIIIEVVLHAFFPVAAKFGTSHIAPIQLLAYVTLISSLMFTVITFKNKQFNQLLNKRVAGWLLLYTLSLAVIPYGIIFYATQFTSAINTALLTQSEAIFAAILAWLILKEKIQFKKAMGIFLILFANIVVLYDGNLALNMADIAMFIAPLSFVFGNMIAKKLQAEGIGWSPILLFRTVIGGIILLIAAHFMEGLQIPSSNLWLYLIFFSFFVQGLAKICWQIALHRMDVSKATAIGMTYPVISVAIAYFWLQEVPSAYQWLGVVFTAIGIVLLMKTTSKQWTDPTISLADPD